MTPSRMPSRFRWTLTAVYWLALTRALLVSSPWQEFGAYHLAKEPDPSDPVSSFSLHASAYGVLGLLLFWSTIRSRKMTRGGWLLAAVAHGAICEVLQGFVPNRWPNIDDALANAAGILIAAAIGVALERWLARAGKTAPGDAMKKAA